MISDSTPLICLAKINRLDILKKLYRFIIIPESVKEEILIENKEGYAIIKEALESGWIKIVNPENNKELGIGKGENAAINLAREKKDFILLDDAFAIKVAKSLNINFLRTTSVIFVSVGKKLINKKEAINIIKKLIENGYYISPHYYTSIIEKLQE